MAAYLLALPAFLHDKTHMSIKHHVHPVLVQVLFSLCPAALFDPRVSEQPMELAWITYVVQAAIFPIVLWLGYLKWRRRW
jgi:hypothetical protein